MLAEAERLGVLVPIGDGRFRVPSPSLLAVAEEVVARGISLAAPWRCSRSIERHCESRVAVRSSSCSCARSGGRSRRPTCRPSAGPRSSRRSSGCGPVASEALMAIFQRRMSAQIEGAFEEITRRLSERAPDAEEERWACPIPMRSRAEMLERWEQAAAGWGKRARSVREFGMPVSAWMIDHAELQPGQRVLELAAGPGDTGFLAAELIRPGGTLDMQRRDRRRCSTSRAPARRSSGIENVEFKQLELEWIDLETASVDVDRCAGGGSCSRSIPRPRCGRYAACCARADALRSRCGTGRRRNPWATIPTRALVELGHTDAARPRRAGDVRAGAAGSPAGAARGRRVHRRGGRGRRAAARVRQRRGVHGRDPRPLEHVRPRCSTRFRTSSDRKCSPGCRSSRSRTSGPTGSCALPARSLVAAADA